MKVQTAFWKREVISSGHEPGAHKHNPGPALPGGYSSLFPRGCTNGGGSPALPRPPFSPVLKEKPREFGSSPGNATATSANGPHTPPPSRLHRQPLAYCARQPPTLRPPFPALMGQKKSSAVKSSFALSTQVLQLPRKPPENTRQSLLHVPGAPVSLKLHNPPCLTATPTLPGHGRV